MVYAADLGDDVKVAPGWSVQAAAGVHAPAAEAADVAWRPGGGQFIAYNHATNRLFVLMHVGEGWTHKKEGTELWILDTVAHALIKRIALRDPASNVSVSQDAASMIYLTGRGPKLTVMDPQTGAVVRSIDQVGGGPVMTASF